MTLTSTPPIYSKKFSSNHLTFNSESEMVINTQEVLLQQPKTKHTDTMQPILDLLTRLVIALELIAAKHGNGAPSNVVPFEVEKPAAETETKPAAKGKAKPAAKEEPKVDFEALRAECKASITALVESGRKDAAKKVLAAHGVAKLGELADEKLPEIKADFAKLEEEDLS